MIILSIIPIVMKVDSTYSESLEQEPHTSLISYQSLSFSEGGSVESYFSAKDAISLWTRQSKYTISFNITSPGIPTGACLLTHEEYDLWSVGKFIQVFETVQVVFRMAEYFLERAATVNNSGILIFYVCAKTKLNLFKLVFILLEREQARQIWFFFLSGFNCDVSHFPDDNWHKWLY